MVNDISELMSSLQEIDLFEKNHLGKIETLISESVDRASAIRELVRSGYLTTFQANLVNQRKAKDLLVGPYVLLQRLGAGGIGEVYQARHRHIRTRTAALKVIRADRLAHPYADRELAARFEREPEIIARLSHANIVKVFDAGRDGDRFYLVMEHLEGKDLQKWAKDTPLPFEMACDCIYQAAQGLQHLQQRGMVHRDIKPANLFVTSDGTLKILDLGLVLVRDSRSDQETVDELTNHVGALGTPAFWSPEQALNPHLVDIRADIYSLGRTFYYLLTGTVPPTDQMPVEVPSVLDLRPAESRALAAILRKMTARDPQQRYASPLEVAAAVAPFCGKHRAAPSPAPRIGLNPLLLVAAGAALVMLLLGITLTVGLIVMLRPPNNANIRPEQKELPAKQEIVAGLPKKDREPIPSPKEKPPIGEKTLPEKKEDPPLVIKTPPDANVDPPIGKKAPPEKFGALGKSRVLIRHAQPILGVAFVPGKAQAISCSMEDVIWWDLLKDQEIKRHGRLDFAFPAFNPKEDFQKKQPDPQAVLAERSPLGAIVVEPTGKRAILGGSSHLTVWDLATWKKQQVFTQPHSGVIGACVAVTDDGRFALHGNWKNLVHVYDLAKGVEYPKFFPGTIACFSGDGKKILTGTRSQFPRDIVRLSLFDLETGQPIKSFGEHRESVQAVALSRDGKYALSVGHNGTEPILWDMQSFEEVRRFKGHTSAVLCLAFSADGKKILTGSSDTTARLWNVADGVERDRFVLHSKAVQAIAFSPGDHYALTGGADQMMGVWELKK